MTDWVPVMKAGIRGAGLVMDIVAAYFPPRLCTVSYLFPYVSKHNGSLFRR